MRSSSATNTVFDQNHFYSHAHPTIRFVWRVLESCTPEQKRNFLRLTWSRSKLPRGIWPRNNNGELVKFKIVPKQGYVGLPLAHTCFFLLELPVYETEELCRQSLLTAVTYGAREGFHMA